MKDSYIELQVIERIRETPSVITLVLQPLNRAVHYKAGQFLTLTFEQLGPKEIRRSYSFCTTPGVDPQLAISVKKKANGLVSQYLHRDVEVGDLLYAANTAGQFTLSPGKGPRDLFFIGGGSGITPLFSLLKAALYAEPDSHIHLLFANSNEQEIIYAERLQQLVDEHDHLHVTHILSNPQQSVQQLRHQFSGQDVKWGRISNALVERWASRSARHDRSCSHFFLCGPEGLMLKSKMALGYLGFSEAQVHQEDFIIRPPRRPVDDTLLDASLSLQFRGTVYDIPIKGGETILEAAENQGIKLPYSCRSGSCTSCSAQCTSGKAVMYTQHGPMDTTTTKGLVFTCVAYPLTPTLSLDMK